MLSIISKAIKETHADILGLPLFIALVIYFVLIEDKSVIEWILLASCVIATIVDEYNNMIYFRSKKNINHDLDP